MTREFKEMHSTLEQLMISPKSFVNLRNFLSNKNISDITKDREYVHLWEGYSWKEQNNNFTITKKLFSLNKILENIKSDSY